MDMHMSWHQLTPLHPHTCGPRAFHGSNYYQLPFNFSSTLLNGTPTALPQSWKIKQSSEDPNHIPEYFIFYIDQSVKVRPENAYKHAPKYLAHVANKASSLCQNLMRPLLLTQLLDCSG